MGQRGEIAELVRMGYLVRTRTDADTKEARANNTTRRDAMIASGAQVLSTDYPQVEPAPWSGHFSVALPGKAKVARCNPSTRRRLAVRPQSTPKAHAERLPWALGPTYSTARRTAEYLQRPLPIALLGVVESSKSSRPPCCTKLSGSQVLLAGFPLIFRLCT